MTAEVRFNVDVDLAFVKKVLAPTSAAVTESKILINRETGQLSANEAAVSRSRS